MKMLKRRIAIFLCMLMAITTVAAVAPVAQETVQAAKNVEYYLWGNYGFNMTSNKLSDATTFLVVPKGIKGFYLKDTMSGSVYNQDSGDSDSFYGDTLKGIKFESKNPDIVAVDAKTGKLTAKKAGTALVKVTWKGVKRFGAIEVVDESTMKPYQKANKEQVSLSKKLVKAYDGKITTKNAAKIFKLYKQMEAKNYYSYVANEYGVGENGDFYDKYYIYSMDVYKVSLISTEYYNYFFALSPFSTQSSNCFKISSLSGKGKTITATLPKAVTEDQLIGARFAKWEKDVFNNKSDYTFNIYVRNPKTEAVIPAKATIKKGSKQITIKCEESLKKGTKYELIQSSEYDEWYESMVWLDKGKRTFTAK